MAELVGPAKRVRVYLSEGSLHRHRPLDVALVDLLRTEGASGATVLRGTEGFGGSGVVHTHRLVEGARQLPLVVEWVDTAERVERLLPRVRELLQRGLVTVEDVEVVWSRPAVPVRDVPASLTASDVMSREVATAAPETPVREVVERMLGRVYRAMPVVQGGRVVGMITNGDLLARGGLGVRVELLGSLEHPDLQTELAQVARAAKTAAEVMSREVVTVGAGTPLTRVAELMVSRRFKRLPVVDDGGAMVGIVSRLDVLRTAAAAEQREESEGTAHGLAAGAPLSQALRRDAPMVFPESPLAEVVQAVVATRLNRCLVVDHERRVLGKVTDAEVLERVTPSLRPSALRSLMHRVPFVHVPAGERETEQHSTALCAKDLMVPVAFLVGETRPLREAIEAMLPGQHKVLAVVDRERRLLGILDRADLLRGLLQGRGGG